MAQTEATRREFSVDGSDCFALTSRARRAAELRERAHAPRQRGCFTVPYGGALSRSLRLGWLRSAARRALEAPCAVTLRNPKLAQHFSSVARAACCTLPRGRRRRCGKRCVAARWV